MNKLQNNWPANCAALNEKLGQFKGGPIKLSRAANIDYFAARRYLSGGAHNCNSNALKLCGFFGINVGETANTRGRELVELTDLLGKVWDGSSSHAQLLASLIKSTRAFKVTEKKKKAA